MNEHVDIAIIGSGFAGIGAAIRLQQAGFEDYVVLDAAWNEDSGVWEIETTAGNLTARGHPVLVGDPAQVRPDLRLG